MPDEPGAVVRLPQCETCGGLRTIGRVDESGRRRYRSRVRAAAIVPCPTCVNPRQIEQETPDA